MSSSSKEAMSLVPQLNQKYLDENFKAHFNEAFLSSTPFSNDGLTFSNHPFNYCQLTNFIEDETFLQSLRNELWDIEMFEKNNDLYKFEQSADLKTAKSPCISSLKTFLYESFRIWIEQMTGIALNDTMDLNCARYEYTDALLCHDDKLSSRKIAYILYLVPVWEESDGGLLDLFDVDENGEPKSVVKSLVPQWNSFVFFEVSDKSFHQVSEILTEMKPRLSISGWFHADDVDEFPPSSSISLLELSPAKGSLQSIQDWINPSYFDSDAQFEIRKKFEEDSEVELLDILIRTKYEEVVAAIQDVNIEWKNVGPSNKRNYDVCHHSTLTKILKDFLELFESEEMFLFLSNVTGLRLHKSAKVESDEEEDDEDDDDSDSDSGRASKRPKLDCPQCCCNLRRWRHGSYTLLHDGDDELAGYALDSFLFLDCKSWKYTYGGYISYIAKDEDEELLTVEPKENALALVFRDQETLRFVKHINHQSQSLKDRSRYFSLVGVYTE